ncbi:MAG: tRNA-dihydrouridine synthase, partial [Firmicutes bacterium]|nr:tRNA-dihydrouridine synthase [Bacillota bacterium]
MADLSVKFASIQSPNPFWLASGPLTNTGKQVIKAFEEGWGGAVWKTVGEPIVNVSSRLASIDYGPQRMMGLNNIELISDRSIADNLKEVAEVKRLFPDRAVVVSVMLAPQEELWREVLHRIEDTGADGIELNFGCPHGMSERGMGAIVGQSTTLACDVTGLARSMTTLPMIVKLTPNVTDITGPAQAAQDGGADALSLINTVNSVMGVDLDTWHVLPTV